jgi:hypothetical protein
MPETSDEETKRLQHGVLPGLIVAIGIGQSKAQAKKGGPKAAFLKTLKKRASLTQR